jgi:hypothetical protein
MTVPPPRISCVWSRSGSPVPLVSYLWLGRVPFPLGAVGRRAAHAVSVPGGDLMLTQGVS